jgi:hypothetical protein
MGKPPSMAVQEWSKLADTCCDIRILKPATCDAAHMSFCTEWLITATYKTARCLHIVYTFGTHTSVSDNLHEYSNIHMLHYKIA